MTQCLECEKLRAELKRVTEAAHQNKLQRARNIIESSDMPSGWKHRAIDALNR